MFMYINRKFKYIFVLFRWWWSQRLKWVGVWLYEPVFSYGPIKVANSRTIHPNNIKLYTSIFTNNITFRHLLYIQRLYLQIRFLTIRLLVESAYATAGKLCVLSKIIYYLHRVFYIINRRSGTGNSRAHMFMYIYPKFKYIFNCSADDGASVWNVRSSTFLANESTICKRSCTGFSSQPINGDSVCPSVRHTCENWPWDFAENWDTG